MDVTGRWVMYAQFKFGATVASPDGHTVHLTGAPAGRLAIKNCSGQPWAAVIARADGAPLRRNRALQCQARLVHYR
jgi:hypothetical protein